jgi:hypothetical protein
MIEFILATYIISVAAKKEGQDWMRIESARDDALKTKDVKKMFQQVERVRRVTWRMGVLGASTLATLLYFMNVIPSDKWVSTVAASWIIITSVLNFRAYHLEDEGSRVFTELQVV